MTRGPGGYQRRALDVLRAAGGRMLVAELQGAIEGWIDPPSCTCGRAHRRRPRRGAGNLGRALVALERRGLVARAWERREHEKRGRAIVVLVVGETDDRIVESCPDGAASVSIGT